MLLARVTIFLSAFLLFVVQPAMTKFFLPWFGGSASVWATALMFFTTMLLVGYLYAHALSRFPLRVQTVLHGVLLTLSLFALAVFWIRSGAPLLPTPDLRPDPAVQPSIALITLLFVSVGLPYLVLSSTSPLIQSWFHRAGQGTPYGLYALSNVGSLGALLFYPFLIEPFIPLKSQAIVWGVLFVLFVGCIAATGLHLLKCGRDEKKASSLRISSWQAVRWMALSAVPAFLLVAITNLLTQGVASVPLLWVIPLALYLFTFVLTFSGTPLPKPFLVACAIGSSLLALVLLANFQTATFPLLFIFFLAFLFCGSLLFHDQLYRERPLSSDLTRYYVLIALGGAIGTILVALVAPIVFTRPIEMLFGILVVFVFSFLLFLHGEIFFAKNVLRDRLLGSLVGLLLLCFILLFFTIGHGGRLFEERNFYGSLQVNESVVEERIVRRLQNGRILHGSQVIGTDELFPTSYYGHRSGAGQLMEMFGERAKRVGVVGLGTGTLAAYCRPGDAYRFYELDGTVEQIARTYFFYLSSCEGAEVVIKDARLSLERERFEGAASFDVLLVDAFTDDAIPVHLLTQEAIELYLDRLTGDGVLAVHVSNNYLDLVPVLRASARAFGLFGRVVEDEGDDDLLTASTWVLLSRNSLYGEFPVGREITWTDDYSYLLPIIRW